MSDWPNTPWDAEVSQEEVEDVISELEELATNCAWLSGKVPEGSDAWHGCIGAGIGIENEATHPLMDALEEMKKGNYPDFLRGKEPKGGEE